jgi:transposase
MPPSYVKAYIRRQKNDASDAAAICEAATRPSMRFVGVRSLENQAALMRHKTREMLVSQRTQLLNGLRGHLTEVGVIAAQGPRHARGLAELVEACDETIPFEVCEAPAPLVVQLRNLDDAIARLERTIAKLAQKNETARRLMSIPGFGPITASAMAATLQDTSSFAGPREFAAFLGLTPKQNSSGGKPKLGRISKMGNRNLRTPDTQQRAPSNKRWALGPTLIDGQQRHLLVNRSRKTRPCDRRRNRRSARMRIEPSRAHCATA